MSKTITVRFSDDLYKKVCRHEESKSLVVRKAVQQYFNDSVYNVEVLDVLRDQVAYLKQDKEILQQRLDYLMMPWFQRMLLPKFEQQTKK